MKKQLTTLLLASCLSLMAAIPAFAGWQQNGTGQWQYEQNGAVLTGQWLEDQGSWYYLGADGLMLADTTQMIDGVDYSFDAGGKWIEPSAPPIAVRDGWSLYENAEGKYSIQYPAGLKIKVTGSGGENVELDSDYVYFMIQYQKIPGYVGPEEIAEQTKAEGRRQKLTYRSQSEVLLGSQPFTRFHFTYEIGRSNYDVYVRYDSNSSIFYSVTVSYLPLYEANVMEILDTFSIR